MIVKFLFLKQNLVVFLVKHPPVLTYTLAAVADPHVAGHTRGAGLGAGGGAGDAALGAAWGITAVAQQISVNLCRSRFDTRQPDLVWLSVYIE